MVPAGPKGGLSLPCACPCTTHAVACQALPGASSEPAPPWGFLLWACTPKWQPVLHIADGQFGSWRDHAQVLQGPNPGSETCLEQFCPSGMWLKNLFLFKWLLWEALCCWWGPQQDSWSGFHQKVQSNRYAGKLILINSRPWASLCLDVCTMLSGMMSAPWDTCVSPEQSEDTRERHVFADFDLGSAVWGRECSLMGGRGRELFSGPSLGLLLCAAQEDLCMERWFPSRYV